MQSDLAAEITPRFGRAVRTRRQELGLSQEKLAERASVHHNYVGEVERGLRNIRMVNAVKLAQALELPLSKLLADYVETLA